MVFPSGDAYGEDSPDRASEGWQPEDLPPVPGDEWMVPMEPPKQTAEVPQQADEVPPGEPSPAKRPEDELPRRAQLAFAPLHKRAFGMAVGATCGLVVAALTTFHVLLDPADAPNLGLLAQYFYGYRVSPAGILIGGAWAFGVGFVGGWFFAFSRNFAFAVSIFIRRTRAELAQTRDFLDHI